MLAAGFLGSGYSSRTSIAAFDFGIGHLLFLGQAALVIDVGATGLLSAGAGAIGGYVGFTRMKPVAERVGVRISPSRRGYLPDGTVGLWLISGGITTVSRRAPGPSRRVSRPVSRRDRVRQGRNRHSAGDVRCRSPGRAE